MSKRIALNVPVLSRLITVMSPAIFLSHRCQYMQIPDLRVRDPVIHRVRVFFQVPADRLCNALCLQLPDHISGDPFHNIVLLPAGPFLVVRRKEIFHQFRCQREPLKVKFLIDLPKLPRTMVDNINQSDVVWLKGNPKVTLSFKPFGVHAYIIRP